MLKKLFILIFIFSVSAVSKAQIAKIFVNEFPDTAKISVGIDADYDVNSNAMTNVFLKKFYTGGFIDDEIKSTSLKRLKNTNRLGGNINSGLYASFKLSSSGRQKNNSLFFSVRDRAHFDSQFSKDLFKIGFYGNSEYAGKTANLNNFNLNYIRYQQIQVGIFSSKLDSSARWGVGVSFLKGEQYFNVQAKKAELYTSADGQYINLNTEIAAAKSDTNKNGIGAFNGYGASLDLFFEAPFQTPLGSSKITGSVSDLGAIRFNDKTLTINQDSSFHYSGFQINSIYNLKDSVLGERKKDSIVNTIIPIKKHFSEVVLPTILNFTFETQFNKVFRLTEGFRYVFNGNYKLLFFVTGNFHINPKLIVSTTVGYGGYGNFNYGIAVSSKLGKSFLIRAGSNNIEGYLAPKKTCGQGVYISLIKKFN